MAAYPGHGEEDLGHLYVPQVGSAVLHQLHLPFLQLLAQPAFATNALMLYFKVVADKNRVRQLILHQDLAQVIQ
jgi:hypothetical protein